MSANCRVVLVRPQIAGNLGATARVMHNFGLSDLVLVAPGALADDPEARRLSTQAEPVLDSARTVAELGEALEDCILTAATSARLGGLYRRQPLGGADEIMARLAEASSRGPVAVVFGPERDGLTNAEITRCHYLIHIPTSPDYPALNLGQAAAICLYEFHQASRGHQPPEGMPGEAPAAFGELEQMYQHLAKALNEIHFLHGEKAGSLMHGVRHLIGRAQPTATEVGLLHGLARQIEWYVSRYRGGATAR